MLSPADFFDLRTTAHADLFDGCTHAWDALARLPDYLQHLLATTHTPNAHTLALHPTVFVGEGVHIGAGAHIEPGAYIEGPAVIGAGATVRHGAYVRANTLLAPGAMVGHASETKTAVLLERAAAPHFAYVGDSILGQRVNLGAGTKLSNLPMTSMDVRPFPPILLDINGTRYDTGLAKLGAILGDDVQLGCNCVTNPGALIGPRTLVYALAAVRKGYTPPDSVVKLRQTQQVTARRV